MVRYLRRIIDRVAVVGQHPHIRGISPNVQGDEPEMCQANKASTVAISAPKMRCLTVSTGTKRQRRLETKTENSIAHSYHTVVYDPLSVKPPMARFMLKSDDSWSEREPLSVSAVRS